MSIRHKPFKQIKNVNKQIELLNELLLSCNNKLKAVNECVTDNGSNEDLEYHADDLKHIIRTLTKILN
jgi:hypothetical protein